MLESCVREHHIFKNVWSAQIGESLTCKPEFGNVFDMYTVAVVKDEEITVSHIPRKKSYISHLFLICGGQIVCQVSGNRRVTTDLPQGGLEVPCFYTFVGASKEIGKLKKLAASTPDSAIPVVEPPIKKAKINTSDTVLVSKDQQLEDIWIKSDSYIVSKSDEIDLINSEKLNDRHVNFAHQLLHNQYPNIDGLGCTLLQSKPPVKKILNGLQIIFDRSDHWIVESSINHGHHIVHICDSVYSTVDEHTKKVILNLFDKSKTDIVQVNVNQQVGSKDCGLFAIAISTSLLFGDNVKKIKYRQHEESPS